MLLGLRYTGGGSIVQHTHKRRTAPLHTQGFGRGARLLRAGMPRATRRKAALEAETPRKQARTEEEDELYDDASEEEIESDTSSDEYEPPQEEEDEEVDIEQDDFTRLIHAFTDDPARQDAEPAPRRNTSKWNQSMEEEMESFHHELRDVNGYTRKHKATRIREQALSPEVKALLAQANIAYVEADLPGAIQQLEEVIRIEPTVKGAWYTLGMCFEELGEEEKSIQCRIVGAHLTGNASDEWKSLARRSRERGLLQQSIYCLQQAIKKNRYDIDAIWDRAVLLKDSGRQRAAVEAFQAVLKLQPYDTEVLCELIPLLVSLGEYEVGINILEGMRKASMTGVTHADPNLDPALQEASQSQVVFSLNELVTLADLLLLQRRPLQVILVIKQTIRWMRGAAREDCPEDAQHDLELDDTSDAPLDREVRLRLGKARFMLKDYDEGRRHFAFLAEDTEPTDQPMLFLEMADCFFEHQQYSDALEWYRTLADDGLVDDMQLYVQLGMCFQQLDMPSEAAQVYESVLEATPDNFDVKLGLAEVCEELGQRDRALQLVNEVMVTRSQLKSATADAPPNAPLPPAATEADEGTSLSFFNETHTMSEAPTTPNSATRSARTGISFAERQRLEQLREEETRLAWVQLSALEPRVFVDGFWHPDFVFLDGSVDVQDPLYPASEDERRRFDATRQWMQVAGRLIDSFRSMSQLFPKERYTKYRGVVRPRRSRRSKASDFDNHAEALLSRLRDRLVDEATLQSAENAGEMAPEQTSFRTIPFDDWVALFMKVRLVLI